MRVFALDLASTTGYAVLEKIGDDCGIKLVKYGAIVRDKPVVEYGSYPFSYYAATNILAQSIIGFVQRESFSGRDKIVVEETNQTKESRYAQKYLEFLHYSVLHLISEVWNMGRADMVAYVSTGEWKRTLGIKLSKEQRKQNQKLSEIKKLAVGGADAVRTAKKAAGIRGKVTSKHLSVAYVNQRFGLELKQKDDDVADAICLGEAYLKGAKCCDGT